MGVGLDIAFTHLLGRKRQSIVSVLGVALGVGFFVGASSMLAGSQQEFINKLVDNAPHVLVKDEFRSAPEQAAEQVFADGAVALRGVKPRDPVRGIRNAAAIIEALEQRPGVAVAPALTGQVILRYGGQDRGVSLVGIDPGREVRVSALGRDLVAGHLDELATHGSSIVIGQALARRLALGLGDTVVAVSPAGNSQRLKIVGLYRTGVSSVDLTITYTLLRRAQTLFERPNVVNQLRIKLADYEGATALARGLEDRYRYKAESWQETNQDILSLLTIRNIIMYTVVGAILVVATFGIYNVISTIVHEKVRDIAILKSMGFTPADIRRIFLAEGVFVGVAGALLGWAIGFAIIHGMESIELNLSSMVDVQRFLMDHSPWHYAVGGGFAAGAAVLAAFLPARRAALLRPVETLRGAA
jgi:lipoprotein-releasing system permease protein